MFTLPFNSTKLLTWDSSTFPNSVGVISHTHLVRKPSEPFKMQQNRNFEGLSCKLYLVSTTQGSQSDNVCKILVVCKYSPARCSKVKTSKAKWCSWSCWYSSSHAEHFSISQDSRLADNSCISSSFSVDFLFCFISLQQLLPAFILLSWKDTYMKLGMECFQVQDFLSEIPAIQLLWEVIKIHTACTERHLLDFKLLTSQESPVYWGGQEQRSTVKAGPPVPVLLASSRPTSPRLSRWLWVKYKARILRPTMPDRTLISSSLETGLLVMAWRQFPCKLQTGYLLTHTGEKKE